MNEGQYAGLMLILFLPSACSIFIFCALLDIRQELLDIRQELLDMSAEETDR